MIFIMTSLDERIFLLEKQISKLTEITNSIKQSKAIIKWRTLKECGIINPDVDRKKVRIATVSKTPVLLTNNIDATKIDGSMSHVWIGTLSNKKGGIAFRHYYKACGDVRNVKYWAHIPRNYIPRINECGEVLHLKVVKVGKDYYNIIAQQ